MMWKTTATPEEKGPLDSVKSFRLSDVNALLPVFFSSHHGIEMLTPSKYQLLASLNAGATVVGNTSGFAALAEPNKKYNAADGEYYAKFSNLGKAELTFSNDIPRILVRIPTEMKVSSNGAVTAELDPMKSALTAEMRTPPQLITVPSVFDVAGPSRPSDLSWKWDIYPKAIGSGRSITLQFPATAKFDFKLGEAAGKNIVVSGNTVTAAVDVRDELGLTMAERTIATAFASIVALLGTFFGFPFLKSRLEPRVDVATTTTPLPEATPTSKPAGQRKTSKHKRRPKRYRH